MTVTHFLYRLYDRDGDLLYIGVSKDPWRRFRGHRRTSPWIRKARRGRIQVFPTIDAALAAEREAIRTERPRFNVVHNRDTAPRPPLTPRSWFLIRAFDAHGRLIKVGHTQSLEQWLRNQAGGYGEWRPRCHQLRMYGPYEKPALRELARAARREVVA